MEKIGIIGFGNMGSAIALQLKNDYNIFVFDKDENKTRDLSGVNVVKNIEELVKQTDTIILAVKPQDFDSVLSKIKPYVRKKLIISIAAGIKTQYIEKKLGEIKVVRVMPNIGAKIKEAESSLCKGKKAEGKDLDFSRRLFNYIGKTWVMEEEMMDAATAISGSGPAYIYYDMENRGINPLNVPEEIRQEYVERLSAAAIRVGFDPATASDLAACTTGSSLDLTIVAGLSPAELKKQVASPGGTTEAALKILTQGGSWEDAAVAALKKARELSKK